MKKIIFLLSSIFLLAGCAQPLALLGPATGATNGKLVQSSIKSAASFTVKKTTGKSPLQHALAYAEDKNPNKKKEKCISFIEKTNSEACMIVKKQIALTQATVGKKISSTRTALVKKIPFTQDLVKEKKQVVSEKNLEAEDKTKNLLTKPKESTKKLISLVQAKIKEYDERWLVRIRNFQANN
jgi:hypothetical protein